ncbi:MAG: alpha-galactosidase [Spirochaetes bacterium]|uniref:Alpha-galactosidase n=1 Tax=Candidatus Ornithospirochaeta stercoravium TaxID=2840897 RepID=A0A9D9ICD6_9SPIO|nr:alpha-galactosidase [Candidatus Ornithospirochaeta stercoravium]
MENTRICIIGGGSRQWAIRFLMDLSLQDKIGAHVALYDIDRKAAENNKEVAERIFRINGKSHLSVSVASTLDEGLKGVDFIIIAIEPGCIDIRQYDLGLPEEYGIYQSVGDTTGPGGLMRAWRALPLFFDFARAIEKNAPNAWVINYTNPMTLCTAALYKAYPGIKALGCCHEVFGTENFIASIIAKKEEIETPDRRDVMVDVSGLNHFTFVTKALYKGVDYIPYLKEMVKDPSTFPDLTEKAKKRVADGKWFESDHLVALSFLRDFGTLGAAGDRHLAEFVPFFLNSNEEAWRYGFIRTPFSYRVEEDKRKKSKVYTDEELVAAPSDEEGVDILLSLFGERTLKTNVNMPNRGQVRYLKEGHIVESNGYISADSIVPIVSTDPSLAVQSMVKRVETEQDLALEAIWNNDMDLLFQAFISDPLVNINVDKAHELFTRMIASCGLRY